MFHGPHRGAGSRAATAWLLLATLWTAGCVSSGPLVESAAGESALVISAEARARADGLLTMGLEIEPHLTSLVVAGAERRGVELYGLEHRIKSRASLERKIQTAMLDDGIGAEFVVIDDTLRYTVLIDDEPPGQYDEDVADILRGIESAGFEVDQVKNYWPRGDTYSGVNCILSTPQGLTWELQFHTMGSLVAKSEGHDLYEEFRLPQTPVRRKRQIFDVLLTRWDWVEIPEGVLEPRSLHVKEQIILRPRP